MFKVDPSGTLFYETAIAFLDGIDDREHACLLLSLKIDGEERTWAILRLTNVEYIDGSRITLCMAKEEPKDV